MEDIAEQVAVQQRFAIEFVNVEAYRFLTVRFWKDKDLCRISVCRSGLPFVNIADELGFLARLLSVTSTQVDIVERSGFPVSLIQSINQSPSYSILGVGASHQKAEKVDLEYAG